MRPLAAWWTLSKQFTRYALLGGCGALMDLFVFWVLVEGAGLWSVGSNVVSVSCGIITSFALNSRFTFDHTDGWQRRMRRFFVVGLVGLAGSSLLIWVLVHPLSWAPMWAKIATLGPVALGQFAANRWWTFAPTRGWSGQPALHTTAAHDR